MIRTIPLQRDHTPLMMAEGIVYKQTEAWYGNDNRTLSMNVIRARDGKKHPTVVWFTGGGWEQVSKSVHVPQMVYLAEAGYTVATVEYRPSQMAPFPAQAEDCKAAIRYLRANADRWQVDPDAIACMGESAGGHLAALMGTTSGTGLFDVGDNLEYSSKVACTVDWYGPVDFEELGMLRADKVVSSEALLLRANAALDKELARAASPVNYVSSQTPPFLIIHGTGDPVVPFSQSKTLHDKLEAAGCEVTLLAVEDGIHGDITFDGSTVRGEILAFLDKHLK